MSLEYLFIYLFIFYLINQSFIFLLKFVLYIFW